MHRSGFRSALPCTRNTRRLPANTPMPEYSGYPEGFSTRGVPGLKMRPREPLDWTVYYDAPLKEGTTFNHYGVAHEPGSEAARHMTRMRHPLAAATSLEDLQAYPFPEFDTGDTGHIRDAVE